MIVHIPPQSSLVNKCQSDPSLRLVIKKILAARRPLLLFDNNFTGDGTLQCCGWYRYCILGNMTGGYWFCIYHLARTSGAAFPSQEYRSRESPSLDLDQEIRPFWLLSFWTKISGEFGANRMSGSCDGFESLVT